MTKQRKTKLKIQLKVRNPLVAAVMKKGVKRHRNRKKEAKGTHDET